jgi:hypothetical protein
MNRKVNVVRLLVIFNLMFEATLQTYGQGNPDLSTAPSDLTVPGTTIGKPKPGLRVKQTTSGWQNTGVYHTLYLPRNWKPGKKYPVIIEYAGNGYYSNKYGDVSNGTVDGSNLGYGLSKGKNFIWVCMPFVEVKNGTKRNAVTWWGDIEETKKYVLATLDLLRTSFGADTSRVILAGFSRGAIACNYVGLFDDGIAPIWKAFFIHSHYDGVRENWPYPFADRASALKRLNRLGSRPQWISQENSTSNIKSYLLSTGVKGNFTFCDIPYRNHSDQWVLKKIPEAKAARAWLRKVTKN